MKIINSDTARVRPSILVHGLTGGGKSTFAETGGTPLVILTEIKAESVLKQVNPAAVGLVPESLDDLEHLFEMLGRPEKMAKFDRIILDSFTELTLAIPRWIKAKAGQTGTLVKLELSEFGHLRDYALALVKAIQLTGLPSVIIVRSTSKRVGLSERIVPDGMGKSVEELPGKLLPTAEARFDSELGYLIDTTPADHSQRCGLPWLPQVYQGSCLDYLALIEAGPQGNQTTTTAPATAPQVSASPVAKVEPRAAAPEAPMGAVQPAAQGAQAPAPSPAWVDLLTRYAAAIVHMDEKDRKACITEWETHYEQDQAETMAKLEQHLAEITRPVGIDPEAQPEAYKAGFGAMATEMLADKQAAAKGKEHTQAVTDFVDGVSPEVAKGEDVNALLDACAAAKVDHDCLWRYAIDKQQAKPAKDGSKNWSSLSKTFTHTVEGQLKGANRVAFCSWLSKTYAVKK